MYTWSVSLILLQIEDILHPLSFFFFYFQIWFTNNVRGSNSFSSSVFASSYFFFSFLLFIIDFVWVHTYHSCQVFIVWEVLTFGWMWLGIQGCLRVANYLWLSLKFQQGRFVLELSFCYSLSFNLIFVSTLDCHNPFLSQWLTYWFSAYFQVLA